MLVAYWLGGSQNMAVLALNAIKSLYLNGLDILKFVFIGLIVSETELNDLLQERKNDEMITNSTTHSLLFRQPEAMAPIDVVIIDFVILILLPFLGLKIWNTFSFFAKKHSKK